MNKIENKIIHDNKNMIENKWIEYKWISSFILISLDLISTILENFKKDVINELKEDQFIYVLLKLKMLPENDDKVIYRNITHMQRVNKESIDILKDVFYESWQIKSSGWGLQSGDCRTFEIKEVIFSYKIIPLEDSNLGQMTKSKINKLESISKEKIYDDVKFSGYNLPITTDYNLWGEIILQENNKIIIQKLNSPVQYHIIKFDGYNKVEYKIKDITILEFKDEILDKNNLTTFRRTVDNKKIFDYKDGKNILKRKIKKLYKIRSLQKEENLNNKYFTMDIETMTINEEMIPYCICIYINNLDNKSFYLSDYKDSEDMLTNSIQYLMKRKFDGYKAYFHNFSNFDGIFLLKILLKLSTKLDPLINEGDLINILFHFSKRYRISFRDSYLMLEGSLKDLAKSFNVTKKGIFPIYFLHEKYNKNIDINYIGLIPEYKYYSGLTIKEFNLKFKDKSELYWKGNKFNGITPEIYNSYYNSYKDKNNWNLREETIKYCMNDCQTLSEILKVFINEIFSMFRINVIKYPTLPSLAFAIFRTYFMKEENIPLISGELYNFIREGYYGGHVDVYKPYGKKIYRYDANSLYPAVMEPFDMPVGNPIIFEGDISEIKSDGFGFYRVEVTTPEYLEHPILLKKYNNKIIAPLGTWTGVYSTIEINKCKELGYKFKILSGILFEKENIFKNYVNHFYCIKKNTDKNDPKYLISKLFLNTLYGRFGMNPCLNKNKFVNKQEFIQLEKKYDIIDTIDFKNGKELVTYSDNYNYLEDDYKQIWTNVSVSIAAMVTAYARIHMSQFKNNPNFELYYSDTDSIDVSKPLDQYFIGKELGQMKLEHIFDEVIYLAPKVYGAKEGNEELVKVKGLKNPLRFEDLKSLLKKGSKKEKYHEKWSKNKKEGKIFIKDQIYSLTITDKKRELIYENNIFTNTKSMVINE